MTAPGLLIRGGLVVDGTSSPGRRSDIRTRGRTVAEIGPRLRWNGEEEVDASSCYVAPGFIDSHTHFDASLFWDPTCDPMPLHGVTSVVVGNCSLSLAPVRPDDRARLGRLFAYVEDFPVSLLEADVPWSWGSFDELLAVASTLPLAVNVGLFVGHSALRLYVMGMEASERPATKSERRRIAEALTDCLAAGALGLSISLFDSDAEGRPVPSRLAAHTEVELLLDVLGSQRRVLSFIPDVASHDSMVTGVDRMAELCGRAGVTATWNGLFYDERKPQRSREILDRAAELQADGIHIFPQVSPRRLDVAVNWAGGMAFYSLEPWHQLVQASAEEKTRLLANRSWRTEARRAWDRQSRSLIRHKELEHIRLTSVADPADASWVGATLADLVIDRGGHPSDVLADWVLRNDLAPGVVGSGVANGDADGVAELLGSRATLIANSDAGAHLQTMCGAGDTTLLLTRHVRDRADLSIERAVWELTGRQAEVHGLRGRGRLEPGAIADIVVFDLAALSWEQEQLVADLPGDSQRFRRPSGGYRYTIVAGVIVQVEGHLTQSRPGQLMLAGRA